MSFPRLRTVTSDKPNTSQLRLICESPTNLVGKKQKYIKQSQQHDLRVVHLSNFRGEVAPSFSPNTAQSEDIKLVMQNAQKPDPTLMSRLNLLKQIDAANVKKTKNKAETPEPFCDTYEQDFFVKKSLSTVGCLPIPRHMQPTASFIKTSTSAASSLPVPLSPGALKSNSHAHGSTTKHPSSSSKPTPTPSIGKNSHSPSSLMKRRHHPDQMDPLFQPLLSHVVNDLDHFDSDLDEKKAFEEWVREQGNERGPKTIPNMVVKQFRQTVCGDSALIQRLKEIPLPNIEAAVEENGHKLLLYREFNQFLKNLLHDDKFCRVDSGSLFAFFDTDYDGDLDHRELCNGFVMLLSKDGANTATLHRIVTMLHPHSIKDQTLSYLSRFELCLIVEAIRSAGHDSIESAQMHQQLDADLDGMLVTFICDKKGRYAFEMVRDYVRKKKSIMDIIDSITIPRDPPLYKSPLAQFFRNADAEEGAQVFKVMRVGKDAKPVTNVQQRKSIKRPESAEGEGEEEEPSFLQTHERPVGEPGNPNFFSMKGVVFRQFKGSDEPELFWQTGMTTVTPADYDKVVKELSLKAYF